jgi:hypothetical protein
MPPLTASTATSCLLPTAWRLTTFAWASVRECLLNGAEGRGLEQDYPPVVRGALGVTLLFLSLPVGGYGLLYLGAIWTSDTSTGSLIMVGSLLLAIAAALIAAGVVLLRRASN